MNEEIKVFFGPGGERITMNCNVPEKGAVKMM